MSKKNIILNEQNYGNMSGDFSNSEFYIFKDANSAIPRGIVLEFLSSFIRDTEKTTINLENNNFQEIPDCFLEELNSNQKIESVNFNKNEINKDSFFKLESLERRKNPLTFYFCDNKDITLSEDIFNCIRKLHQKNINIYLNHTKDELSEIIEKLKRNSLQNRLKNSLFHN